MDNFSCYIQMTNNTAKDAKTPRFEVTATAGYFEPLNALKNAKNETVFYLLDNKNGINCIESRKSGYRLQCKDSVNFSSLYDVGKIEGYNVFIGDPPQKEFLKPKKNKKTGKETPQKNPFFNNRNDGYIILANTDFTIIEIFVVSDGRHLIKGIAMKLLDGWYNEAISLIRKTATPTM